MNIQEIPSVAANRRSAWAALLASLILSSAASVATARTMSVCKANCQYSMVQDAIDAARSGDTITIGIGTYYENLLIVGKRLTIIGAGEDFTVLDGRFRGAVIDLGGDVLDSPLDSTKLADLTLYAVTVTHGGQRGIAVHGGSLNLQNSAVIANRVDDSDPVCGDSGGGILVCTANATINKSIIAHNRTGGSGGGISAEWESNVTITSSTVARNTATDGGGVAVEQKSAVSLSGSSLSDNIATDNGGAIHISPADFDPGIAGGFLTMSSTSVANNHADFDGGGLWAVAPRGRRAARISNSVIARNTAGHDGGGLAGAFNLDHVFVVQNSAGASGGGIQVGLTATSLNATASTLAGNVPNDCAGPAGACPAP